MANSLPIALTLENEVLNFQQREGENLKDAWYRICNTHNKSTQRQSTFVLLRCFYMGITTWYRFILDTITGGNFRMCPPLDAFNALGNLVGSPPLMVNGTILTLEHVMQKLDAIETNMITLEHVERLETKMQNLANRFGSKLGDAIKILREKEPIIHDRLEESPARIDKLEEILSNLSLAFSSINTTEKTPTKISKGTRSKGETSSSNKGDLKMISVHPDFVDVIYKSEFFNFLPRSFAFENSYAKVLRDSKCSIEELETNKDAPSDDKRKDDNT